MTIEEEVREARKKCPCCALHLPFKMIDGVLSHIDLMWVTEQSIWPCLAANTLRGYIEKTNSSGDPVFTQPVEELLHKLLVKEVREKYEGNGRDSVGCS